MVEWSRKLPFLPLFSYGFSKQFERWSYPRNPNVAGPPARWHRGRRRVDVDRVGHARGREGRATRRHARCQGGAGTGRRHHGEACLGDLGEAPQTRIANVGVNNII